MEQNQYQFMPQPPAPRVQKPPPHIDRRDTVFVLLSFVIGFAFCEFILFGGAGIAVPVFFAVFYAAAAVYLSGRHRVFSRLSVLTFIPVLLVLLCFALYDNMPLRALNVFALWFFAALNLTAMAGLESRPLFWAGTWFDILKFTFFLPFHHIDVGAKALGRADGANRRKTLLTVILTLVVISPVAILVLCLLASSDAGFQGILSNIGSFLTARVWQYIGKVVVAVLLTFPLFSLLYSLRYDKRPEKHPLEGFMVRLGALQALVTSVGLGVFSLFYALYIGLQADYFFSALGGRLPAAFTYAGYARRGFFELVGVVFINFCLIILALAFTRRGSGGRPSRGCRVSVLILAALTLLLIVTAASKMAMYVASYGLTPLRVYTSWFILLLGLLTVFILLKVIFPGFKVYRVAAVCTISLYLLLNLSNVDGIIAGYNIHLYQDTGSKLDTSVFYELSDSAIPQIAALQGDPQYGAAVRTLLDNRKKEIDSTSWQNFSFAKYFAGRSLGK